MNVNEKFARTVLTLMKNDEVNRRTVADAINVKYSTFCDWVNPNHPSSPSVEELFAIADYFGVKVDSLVDDVELNVDDKIDVALKTKELIPVLGKVPAGIPYEAIEEIEPLSYELIPKKWLVGDRRYFGLVLDGDSMADAYNDGDTVVFLKSSTCESGDHCCIRINHGEATFKKIVIESDGIRVIPLNANNRSGFKEEFHSKDSLEYNPIEILGIAIYKIPGKVSK